MCIVHKILPGPEVHRHSLAPLCKRKFVSSSTTYPTSTYILGQTLKIVTLYLNSFVLVSVTMQVELPVASHYIRVVFFSSSQEHVSVVFTHLSAMTLVQIIVCGISAQVGLIRSIDWIPVPCHSYELFHLKLQSKV